MNKPFWCLSTGCNSRHLTEVSVFDRLKDAIKLISALPDAIAYSLTRHQEQDNYTQAIITVVSKRVI